MLNLELIKNDDLNYKKFKNETYHKFLNKILVQLNEYKVIELKCVDGEIRKFVAVFCFVCADNPEAQLLCNNYNSGKANYPCRICWCPRNEMNSNSINEFKTAIEINNISNEINILSNSEIRGFLFIFTLYSNFIVYCNV